MMPIVSNTCTNDISNATRPVARCRLIWLLRPFAQTRTAGPRESVVDDSQHAWRAVRCSGAGRTVLAYDGAGPVEFSLWRANSLSGIARDLELQQRLTGALEVLPDPADADALRVWWMTLPQRWG